MCLYVVSLQVKLQLRSIKHLCYTVDLWTAVNGHAFVGVTLHYIDADWQLQYACLGISRLEGPHTAQNVAAYLKEVFTEFGIDKSVWLGVCDGGLNIVNGIVDILKHEHQFCFCHLANNVLKASLEVRMDCYFSNTRLLFSLFAIPFHAHVPFVLCAELSSGELH